MGYNIQLNGKMEIETKLDENKDISFVVKRAGLVSINSKPRSVDGEEEEITYKYENLDEVIVIQEDKVLAGKPKKGSQAQALRYVLNSVYEQQFAGDYEDFETYYKEEMAKIIDSYKSKLI